MSSEKAGRERSSRVNPRKAVTLGVVAATVVALSFAVVRFTGARGVFPRENPDLAFPASAMTPISLSDQRAQHERQLPIMSARSCGKWGQSPLSVGPSPKSSPGGTSS